jgi:DNA mismatch repair ATPase MutS
MLEFKKYNELEEKLNHQKKITRIWSLIRAILAIASIIFSICLLSIGDYLLYGLLSGVFLALFFISVSLSNPSYKALKIIENKCKVYERHNQRRNKNFPHFSDNGIEFKDKEDYKLSDLDIFGPKSLYQYLNEAKTPLGRALLAKQFKDPIELDSNFKSMVKNLAENEDSLELEASLMEFKKGQAGITTDEFLSIVSKKIEFKIWYFIPIISFMLMLVYIPFIFIFGINPYIPLVFLGVNFISSKLLIRDDILTKDANSYYYLSDLYVDLSLTIKNTNIEDEYYQILKNKLVDEIPLIKKIRGIYTFLNIRKNLLLNIILNIIFSFDSIMILILRFKIKNGIELKDSLKSISLIELALSYKNIGMDNMEYCVPEDGDKIDAIDMYHPFVLNCIPNSISLDSGIVLTGSNMSGNTTFMRTLGIYILLKNAGSIVPAKSFKAPNMDIYTSLRANDMLQEGVSTFYAEIRRMKKINQAIKESKCLVLVDEIFKGTNALERIEASKKVIEKLNNYHAIFIIYTHDFELCDTKGITSYHFEENYIDDKISFDYKLKKGPGIKGNALYLLKMSGIIEE